MTYGDQPGYDKASSCGAGHGTFGYLGEQGARHDLGQGDKTAAGSVKLGADGPATGSAAPSAATARQAQPGGSVAVTGRSPG